MDKSLRIVSLEVAECRLPLPRPIRLGRIEIDTRDYVCLRVVANNGEVGYGVGYPRGTTLFESIATLAPRLIGSEPAMRRRVIHEIERATIVGRSGLARALSAIDIALWDLFAREAHLPLFALLGGCRREVPLMAVAGYYRDQRTEDDIASEVDRLAMEGYRRIKLMIDGNDPTGDRTFLARMIKVLDGRATLAVDAHWSWSSIDEALGTCRELDALGLAFIEDPFLPQQWRATMELASKLRTPIAAGEDLVDLFGVHDMLEAVAILRFDATSSGGITAMMSAIAMAAVNGKPTLPHVFPALHAHIAAASPHIPFVESIPVACGADPLETLFVRTPRVEAGVLLLDDTPGNGLAFDWEKVVRLSARHVTFS